jgi:WD40 repeat protein
VTVDCKRRYAGEHDHNNSKDTNQTITFLRPVNFLGWNDEYVTSGSDDGLFFLWDKATAQVKGIWEGDGSIVNCVEAHPSLPLIAVSGIDNTVKIFAPDRLDQSELTDGDELGVLDGGVYRWKSASKLHDLATILANNANPQRRLHQVTRLRLEDLALHLGVSRERLNSTDCNIQVSRQHYSRCQRDILNSP